MVHGWPVWRSLPSLTDHAQVLVCIAHDPGVRVGDIGERARIKGRAARRVVAQLAAAGCIIGQRNGRRNHCTISAQFPLPDRIAREQNIGELLEILTATHGSGAGPDRGGDRTATSGSGRGLSQSESGVGSVLAL
jgi:hypothetical protein